MSFKDVLTNTEGKFSHSKIWCNIAYLAGTYKFIVIPEPSADIWLAYLGIVGGAALASKLISMKYKGDSTQ